MTLSQWCGIFKQHYTSYNRLVNARPARITLIQKLMRSVNSCNCFKTTLICIAMICNWDLEKEIHVSLPWRILTVVFFQINQSQQMFKAQKKLKSQYFFSWLMRPLNLYKFRKNQTLLWYFSKSSSKLIINQVKICSIGTYYWYCFQFVQYVFTVSSWQLTAS